MHFRGGGVGHTTGHNTIPANYVSPDLFRIIGYNPHGIDNNTEDAQNTLEDYDVNKDAASETESIMENNDDSDCEDNGKYVDILEMENEESEEETRRASDSESSGSSGDETEEESGGGEENDDEFWDDDGDGMD